MKWKQEILETIFEKITFFAYKKNGLRFAKTIAISLCTCKEWKYFTLVNGIETLGGKLAKLLLSLWEASKSSVFVCVSLPWHKF